ncbi:DUF2480 family protein [Lutibacter sp.]|uniref:DUF2480 family protein n=1 Tax=Lutibacter sp. TaxID=1925666 RepID=UPI00273354C1|nr:DUF2480 family protein [Lutibacter sp.]MDP3312394.1 DUF2480 family protein [Lutibacter sp.]
MVDEIINRVANSKLITFDLEDYYPSNPRTIIDIKVWLFHELILKEVDFRASLKNHDWTQYQNHFVALTCTADAIIPSWAYLLITTYLTQFSKKIVVGTLNDLENAVFFDIINNLDTSSFIDKPIIIKGCSNKPIPETAYVHLVEKLKPVASSIMFGEACSSVPLYKKSN